MVLTTIAGTTERRVHEAAPHLEKGLTKSGVPASLENRKVPEAGHLLSCGEAVPTVQAGLLAHEPRMICKTEGYIGMI